VTLFAFDAGQGKNDTSRITKMYNSSKLYPSLYSQLSFLLKLF